MTPQIWSSDEYSVNCKFTSESYINISNREKKEEK